MKSIPAQHRMLAPALLLSLFAVLTGCKEDKKAPPPPPPAQVLVAPPTQRDVPISTEWLGTLDGFVNAEIRAQVSGYLLRQAYTEGMPVKKGDLLFQIDDRTFKATYQQVKANFDKTQIDLDRITRLSQGNVVSQQEVDNARAANLIAKAALETAELNLEFTKVVSPIDGVAGIALAQIGNLVGPSTGVLTTVSTLDPIKVYFTISEQSYLEFRKDHPDPAQFEKELELKLILSNGTIYPHTGKFYAIDRQVDVRTGALRLAGTFPNPDLILRPGQFARVSAVVRTEKGALLVPQRAVIQLQGSFQIATVDNENKAHLRAIKVGERVGTEWIIKEGLKPDDRVVIEGIQKVREGATVDPKPYNAAGATTPVQKA
ncbi:MAG TPA: efflux RND transporter periplasmic adaptor subunit [Opitutaceae bacterium]|nr:efflux RND transporter periplasmic adaptor subunit [Opitutaceae bacterium]